MLIEGRRPTRARPARAGAAPLRRPASASRGSTTCRRRRRPASRSSRTSTLVVRGRRLTARPAGGARRRRRRDDRRTRPTRGSSVTLPAGLRAGVQGVQVKHLLRLRDPDRAAPRRRVERRGVRAPPRLRRRRRSTPTRRGRRTVHAATRTLDRRRRPSAASSASRSCSTATRRRPAPPTPSTAGAAGDRRPIRSSCRCVDVERGDYLVRVQVDGAESPLDLDPASPTFGPRVTI